jgi:hypothetical protein
MPTISVGYKQASGGERRLRRLGLEGSRFGAQHDTLRCSLPSRVRPENMRTGGSRKLPSVIHLRGGSVRPRLEKERRAQLQSCRALGSSREPPPNIGLG